MFGKPPKESRIRMSKNVIILLAIMGAIAFSILGWYGQQVILKKNQCKMTYSAKETYSVLFEWKTSGYKLVKISNNNSKNLNSEPVLFIPGHLGR